MTITQTSVVDFIGVEEEHESVYLAIADHLEWSPEEPEHLLALQDKINTYIQFIESGQVYEAREGIRAFSLKIKVFGAHPLSAEGQAFYRHATEVLRPLNVALEFEQRSDLASL